MSHSGSPDGIVMTADDRGVYTITLDRPSHRNAFHRAMLNRIVDVFQHIEEERTARVVVIRGNGPVFCAGGDIGWMRECGQMDASERSLNAAAIGNLFRVINDCFCPTVATVQGAVLGGGIGIISACDFVSAASSTVFATSEAVLGLVPACLAPFLLEKIGHSHARRLFLSGQRITALESHRIGLVHEVVENESDLEAARERLVNQLLKVSPAAQVAAKQLLQSLSRFNEQSRPFQHTEILGVLEESWASPDGQEGMSAFLEKRPPCWDRGT